MYTKLFMVMWLMVLCALPLQAQDLAEKIIGQASCLQKLTELNDRIHVKAYEKKYQKQITKASAVQVQLFGTGGGRIDVSQSRGLSGLSGNAFVETLGSNIELYADMLEPLCISNTRISAIESRTMGYNLQISGLMSLSADYGDKGLNEAQPFIANFSLGPVIDGSYVTINSIRWGAEVQWESISHEDVFAELQTADSTLYAQTQKKIELIHGSSEADLMLRRIAIHQSDRLLMEEQMGRHSWDFRDYHMALQEAQKEVALVWSCLPDFTPIGLSNLRSMFRFTGVGEVDDLILKLVNNEEGLNKYITSFLTSNRDPYSTKRISGFLIRAWHQLINEHLSQPGLYFQDLEDDKAGYFPQVKEVSLMKVIGYAREGDYDESINQLRSLNARYTHTVMSHIVNEDYTRMWEEYGKEMDGYFAHDETLLANFLSTIFGNESRAFVKLSEKAESMGEMPLSVYCYEVILTDPEQNRDADTWYYSALAKGKTGMDPYLDIAQAKSLSNKTSYVGLCAEAQYLYQSGQTRKSELIFREKMPKEVLKKPLVLYYNAICTRSHTQREKKLKKFIKEGEYEKADKHFRLGYLAQRIADNKELAIGWAVRKKYYSKANFHYKKALKGMDKALVNKKMAEVHVQLNELEDAEDRFAEAIANQERGIGVYFAQSLLNLAAQDSAAFRQNVNHVQQLGEDDLGSSRDRALFRFLLTYSKLEELARYTVPKSKQLKKRDLSNEISALSQEIDTRVFEMYALFSPQDSAYARLCQATLDSFKGYNDNPDRRKGKAYKEEPVRYEQAIELMTKDSDLELYFFDDNDVLKLAADLNDAYNEHVYKRIPKRKKGREMSYLKGSSIFKDSYNYLLRTSNL